MRFLRLLITLAAIAAVYFAQYIFQYQSLQEFFPQRLLDWFPSLLQITRWLPEDLWRVALWASAAATVGVGLVAPTWPELREGRTDATLLLVQRRGWFRRTAQVVALLVATGLGGFLALGGKEALWLPLAWVVCIVLYLLGARGAKPLVSAKAAQASSWRVLAVVLIAAGLLFNWPLRTVVPPLPDEIVTLGLHSLALVQGAALQVFAPTQTTFGGLALLPLALAIRLSGDGLLAARSVGTIAALLTIVATWLVGRELFRRTPMVGPYGEWVEDDGRWPALLASGLVAANVVIFHFSRLPIYLEPVAWGTLGLWLWLRSVRTGNRLTLALSGMLIGLATLLYQSGILFLVIMPFWWLGARLLQPQWFRISTQLGEGLRTARRSLLWWGGLWVMIAPLVGLWVYSPELLVGRIQSSWLPDLGQLGVALNLPMDPSAVARQANTGLNLWVAPLLLLAVGCLLLNLDRLVGWLLLSWVGCVLVVGGAMATPTLWWPVMAPLLPALALLVAFTLDRLRTTIVESAGSWAAQAVTYLSIGLVVWAGQASWIDYNQFVRTTITPEHYVGFALRRLDPQRQAIGFIQPAAHPPLWQAPLLRFLVNDKFTDSNVTRYDRNALPTTLPPHTVLVWQPSEGDNLAGEMQARYPGGTVRTRRDQLVNPAVYFYELP